jgi:crotonobetaine/carnitine-CoA ligase
MPKFMLPRYVEIVEALPKTQGTLRTRKFELRDSGLNDQTWDRQAVR